MRKDGRSCSGRLEASLELAKAAVGKGDVGAVEGAVEVMLEADEAHTEHKSIHDALSQQSGVAVIDVVVVVVVIAAAIWQTSRGSSMEGMSSMRSAFCLGSTGKQTLEGWREIVGANPPVDCGSQPITLQGPGTPNSTPFHREGVLPYGLKISVPASPRERLLCKCMVERSGKGQNERERERGRAE